MLELDLDVLRTHSEVTHQEVILPDLCHLLFNRVVLWIFIEQVHLVVVVRIQNFQVQNDVLVGHALLVV